MDQIFHKKSVLNNSTGPYEYYQNESNPTYDIIFGNNNQDVTYSICFADQFFLRQIEVESDVSQYSQDLTFDNNSSITFANRDNISLPENNQFYQQFSEKTPDSSSSNLLMGSVDVKEISAPCITSLEEITHQRYNENSEHKSVYDSSIKGGIIITNNNFSNLSPIIDKISSTFHQESLSPGLDNQHRLHETDQINRLKLSSSPSSAPLIISKDSSRKRKYDNSDTNEENSNRMKYLRWNDEKEIFAEIEIPGYFDSYIIIGPNGSKIPKDVYQLINWSNEKTAVKSILRSLFDRRVLGTHTLTGRPSNAFKNRIKKQTKGQLDPIIISDVIDFVTKMSGRPANKVKAAITLACADEAKALYRRK